MTCPGCGSAETRTTTSRNVGALVMRGKRCEACFGEWATQECVMPGSFLPHTSQRTPVATGGHPQPPAATGGQRISGSESGSGSVSLTLIPDPVSKLSERSERYGGAFGQFWAAYPVKVGKSAALRAWSRKKPPIEKCLATLAWQMASAQWLDGFVPHPATWINQGRWEDEPAPDGPRRPPPGFSEREVRGMTAAKLFVQKGKP
jgi:hypothetical protein